MNRLRRQPQQVRSRRRVERVLDTAAALVDEAGVGALKVAEIARAARVPIGTVYQLFGRKEDIIHALAERFAAGFEVVLERLLPQMNDDRDWRVLLHRVFDAYSDYYRTAPALRQLWVGAQIHPDFVRDDHERSNPRLARRLSEALLPRATVPADQLTLMVLCAWEAGQALHETAFRRHPQGDAQVLEQARILLERYLAPAFEG